MLEILNAGGGVVTPKPPPPGPSDLIGGSITQGFYGEVPAADLITGPSLATLVGLTAGDSINPNEPWLKFALGNKTLFVARKALRCNLSWVNLNALGIVTGKLVTIGERQYIVRLLDGGSSQTNNPTGFDRIESYYTEWNRLLYHVAGKPFANSSNTLASEGLTEGDWAKYTEAQLGMVNGVAGCGSWVMKIRTNFHYGYLRGEVGVSYMRNVDNGTPSLYHGWRPCLELVN